MRYNGSRSIQQRIEDVAETLGSTAKTIQGIKKYYDTQTDFCCVAKSPLNMIYEAVSNEWTLKSFQGATGFRGPAELVRYKSKKICREDLLGHIAWAVESETGIRCMHSKYPSWSAHTQASGSIRYSRSSGCFPLKYVNPCVRWEPLPGGNVECVVFTDRGAEAGRVRVPGKLLVRNGEIDAAMVPGDIKTIGSATRRTRYGVVKIKSGLVLKKIGVAVKMSLPTGYYWEHGIDMATCRAARAEKLAIIDKKNDYRKKSKKLPPVLSACTVKLSLHGMMQKNAGIVMPEYSDFCGQSGDLKHAKFRPIF